MTSTDTATTDRQGRIAARRSEALMTAIVRNGERRALFAALPPLAVEERTFTLAQAEAVVARHTSGYSPTDRQSIAARLVTHGEGVWHAAWLVAGSPSVECGCHPCQSATP